MTRNNPILLHLFGLIVLLMIAFALASCKTQDHFADSSKMVYNNRIDSVYILQHDSIFVDRYVKGDTVYINKTTEHTKWREKTVLQHDTTYITETEIQTVTQYQTPNWCWWCLAALIMIIVAFILRLLYRFRV